MSEPVISRAQAAYAATIVRQRPFSLRLVRLFAVMWTISPVWVQGQTPKQLWTIDLAKNNDFSKRLDISPLLLVPAAVSFLNDSKSVVSFYDDDKTNFDQALKRNRFHVLEIDTQNGALGPELDFPATDERARVLPVADGGFVVLAGAAVTKFGEDFVSKESYPTPPGGTPDARDFWLLDVTPDGGQVVLYHRTGVDNARTLIRLRSKDLSLIKSDPAVFIGGGQLSASNDDYVGFSLPAPCKCSARFLTDDFVIVDRNGHYSVEPASRFGTNGVVALGTSSFVGISGNHNRIVFATAMFSGCSGFLMKSDCTDFAGEIIVMDWKRKKQVAEIEIRKPIPANTWTSFSPSVALSPDGRQLLVLLYQTVTAYTLPN